MVKRTTQAWVAALEPAAVPCGPINTLDEVFADPQVRHRHMKMDLARSDGVMTPTVANPIRLSATPISYELAAPKLGEHTGEVLGELLGLDDAQLAELTPSRRDRLIPGAADPCVQRWLLTDAAGCGMLAGEKS